MHRRILAFDFDGTLAEKGIVPPDLGIALERLRSSGCVLFLVTGRQFESVSLGSLQDLFTGIVWENGAVLYDPAIRETYLPFGCIDPRLVEALDAADVPIEQGRAIVSTWVEHNETVWRVISEWGGDAAVIYNKGAVMILPAGAAKGPGLERLLGICGFSPRNLVGFGDGENDLSLLTLGEFGVAMADAVPSLKAIADLVTARPGPAGVLEVLDTYWLDGRRPDIPLRREHQIPLGQNENKVPISLPGAVLAGNNVGVFGDSSSGKSWVAGLLAEGMHQAGYQILLIDPEGDFRGMHLLSEFVAFDGTHRTLPTPAVVARVLEEASVSVVLDLCSYPVSLRGQYVAELLHTLRSLKERKFRPHWIVLEEAQHFLSPTANDSNTVLTALLPMLAGGGWTFVSYRPDQLAEPVLAALDRCLLTRLSAPETIQALRQKFNFSEESLAHIPRGHVWLCGEHMVRLLPNARRVPHIRHLYKYLDSPLPEHKRFHFRDRQGYLDLQAASLFEFLQLLPDLPAESLAYHMARGDFAAWIEGALGDAELAAHLRKLAHRSLESELLRRALLQRVSAHYAELHARG
ncbi:MAG: HAD hydrolase family protein [Anaerolineae bacterium]|nr:HAD hydrolase family protein [Anaerolineae bacterium]